MTRLSPRERDTLDAILAWQCGRGRAPTRRELARLLGVSLARAAQLVDQLRIAGALTWDRKITIATGPVVPPRAAGDGPGVRRVWGMGVT